MAETVLITGARAPVALDIARSFAAAGFAVHMADSVTARIARWSRVPKRVHRLPPPRGDPAAFAEAVAALVAAVDPLLIVPTCEEVFHLAALGNRSERPGNRSTPRRNDSPPRKRGGEKNQAAKVAHTFSPLTALGQDRLFAPDAATLQRLHAKDRFAELCRELRLASPETHRLESAGALDRFRATARDWVFKPVYSRFGSQARVGPANLDRIAPTGDMPWVAQRRVRGDEVSFYAVCRAGVVTAFAAYRSTWRLGGGAGYAFAALPDDQATELAAMASTLAGTVGQGQFACDAIRDAEDRFQLIECNPRATSGAHLFGRGPGLARAMLDDPGLAAAVPIRSLRAHVAPALWSYGLGATLGRRRLRDWLSEQRRGRDVVGAPRDRWPVAGAFVDSAVFGIKALVARRTLAEQTTADIEWNGDS